MARKIITTLTAYDYKNLKQTYSEKNIINQTNGNEYVIDAASTTNITDINDKSLSVSINPLNGGSRAYCWAYGDGEAKGIFVGEKIQAREEYYKHYGTIVIETDQVITDTNSIAIGLTIDYDKYHSNSDVVSGSNYAGSNSVYKQIMTSGNKQNDGLLTATDKLPYENAVMRLARGDLFGARFWFDEYKFNYGFPSNSISYRCKKLSNDHYQITITYNICTWWGKNWAEAGKWSQSNNATLWVARKLNFSVTANTVTAREIEFNYSRDDEMDYGNAKGKNYPIESNEFLQTDENLGEQDRQSYTLSQQIFNAFDQDRTIVSFTLLNCERYEIGNEYRYLKAEDLIYIKDENDEYLNNEDASGNQTPAVFEIIKTRPVWDGTFSMEVTCRKIDMTT